MKDTKRNTIILAAVILTVAFLGAAAIVFGEGPVQTVGGVIASLALLGELFIWFIPMRKPEQAQG